MKKLSFFTTVAVLALAIQARAETVKLLITNIHCPGCCKAITEAVEKVPGAKITSTLKAGKEKATPVTVEIDLSKSDVGDLAKAANNAETPHRESKGAPSVTLVLPAPSLTKDNLGKVAESLEKVEGIDAKGSKGHPKGKTIHIKLDDKGGGKLADIKKALGDLTQKD
jgi:copper chaperone CopZ